MKLTKIRQDVLSQLSQCEERETIRMLQRRLLACEITMATVTIYGALRFLNSKGLVKKHRSTWEITDAGRAALAQGGGGNE